MSVCLGLCNSLYLLTISGNSTRRTKMVKPRLLVRDSKVRAFFGAAIFLWNKTLDASMDPSLWRLYEASVVLCVRRVVLRSPVLYVGRVVMWFVFVVVCVCCLLFLLSFVSVVICVCCVCLLCCVELLLLC